MRDAIVFSFGTWETFNVPERISLALAALGCRVLHCETPVSMLRGARQPLREVGPGIHAARFGFISSRLAQVPGGAQFQARMLERQIESAASALGLRDAMFLYAPLDCLFPLCARMKRRRFTVHICMDHSVMDDPDYDRYVALADRTLAIPEISYHKFYARYGSKVVPIPQSGNVREVAGEDCLGLPEPPALAGIPRPRLGFWGPVSSRVNRPLIAALLQTHPEWHFLYADAGYPLLPHPNAHALPWEPPQQVAASLQALDVGFMPYDCHDESALHCVPLKLFDYFAFGLPVVSTPVIHLWAHRDLVYLGDSAAELEAAVLAALREPPDSPKRSARMEIARRHSLRNLAAVLRECLPLAA